MYTEEELQEQHLKDVKLNIATTVMDWIIKEKNPATGDPFSEEDCANISWSYAEAFVARGVKSGDL